MRRIIFSVSCLVVLVLGVPVAQAADRERDAPEGIHAIDPAELEKLTAGRELQVIDKTRIDALPANWAATFDPEALGSLPLSMGMDLENPADIEAAAVAYQPGAGAGYARQDGPYTLRFDGYVDMSWDFPRPGDQGRQGSCVGWAVAYARSYLSRVRHGTEPDDMFSPSFYYNQIRLGQGCQEGSRIADAMTLMNSQGGVLMSAMPYNDSACNERPSGRILDKARHNRIGSYDVLDPWNMAAHTRAYIDAGIPVVGGFIVTPDFYFYRGGLMDSLFPLPLGAHAMTVVGYDDYLGAFKIINSWGQDWGHRGYIWMSYWVYDILAMYAYAPIDKTNDALVDGPVQGPSNAPPKRQVIDGITIENNRGSGGGGGTFRDW